MEEENESILTYGSIHYYNQILKDLQQEPTEVCNWDKRRRCDSYYIKMYNQALRDYKMLLDDYTKLNNEYIELNNKLIKLQEKLEGGEKECSQLKK